MDRLIAVFALVVAFAMTAPAQAQGPSTGSAVTPPGSRIGLMPLTGLMEAADFMGFADTATGASVMLDELPPEAWPQMRDGMTAQALRQRGIQEMALDLQDRGRRRVVDRGRAGRRCHQHRQVHDDFSRTGLHRDGDREPHARRRGPLLARADVRAMLASTIAVQTASISPRDALAFGFEETPRLKLLQTLGRQAAALREDTGADRVGTGGGGRHLVGAGRSRAGRSRRFRDARAAPGRADHRYRRHRERATQGRAVWRDRAARDRQGSPHAHRWRSITC